MTRHAPSIRLYRGLLALYPAEFRDHFAGEMTRAFSDLLHDHSATAALLGMYFGLLIDAPKEHAHMIRQDLVYAFRAMRREKLAAAVAILVLALGIGSTVTVFTLFNGIMLRPLPYPDQDRLVYIEEVTPDRQISGAVAHPNYLDFRADNRSLQDLAMFGTGLATLRGDFEAERIQAAASTASLFPILGVTPLLGRSFTDIEDQFKAPTVVLLGEALWRRRFGADTSIVGKTITLGAQPAKVIGVMPATFHFPDRAELWYPLQIDPRDSKRTNHGLEVVGRLRPGVTAGQAQADLRAIMDRITREHPSETYRQTVNVQPYRGRNTRRIGPVVYTLLGAVAFVLLIACANIVNLLLVRASARSREIAVRGALGASRSRLVRQFVVESALLGGFGAIGGMLLAWIAVPALVSLAPANYLPKWMSFAPNGAMLAFVIALTGGTGIAVGLVPAFSASRFQLVDALKEAGRSNSAGSARAWFRSSLVVAEVAMSVLLLAGAGLMVRTFLNLSHQRTGFGEGGDLVTFQTAVPGDRYPNGPAAQTLIRSVQREFVAAPGVLSAAAATAVPLMDGWGRSITAEGAPPLSLKDAPLINHVVVTPNYFRTLEIPILQGRDFDEHDAKNPLVTLVDEGLARKYWPRESAVGKRVRFGPPEDNEPWHTIVGVVGIARNQSLRELRRNSVYLPEGEFQFGNLNWLVRTVPNLADPARMLRSRLAAVDPNIAVSRLMTLKQVVDNAVWQERFFATVFAGFGVLALILAIVGLYGVMAYAVSRRTHEMGIRMALGATASEIRRMILLQSGKLIVLGLAIGTIAAIFLTRLLKTQLYEVRPGDPTTLVAVAAILTTAALAASYIPARKATRVDPMLALREE